MQKGFGVEGLGQSWYWCRVLYGLQGLEEEGVEQKSMYAFQTLSLVIDTPTFQVRFGGCLGVNGHKAFKVSLFSLSGFNGAL